MLEELKEKVRKIALESQRIGLCKHKSGNFSIRDKKTNLVVISPSGIDREILQTDDIVVMDLENNIIECKDGVKPSSEAMMHFEIYKAREDVFSVVHTHSKMATSFAVLKKPIPAIIFEVAGFGLKEGIIPVADYKRPGTVELSKSVIEPILKSDMILLEKHGTVSVGSDIEDAFLKSQYIEEIAEIYFNSLLINNLKEPEVFKVEELQKWKYPDNFKFEK